MSTESELLVRLCETYREYLALGSERSEGSGCLLVRNRAHPQVYDANHASGVRAEGPGETAAALESMDRVFGDLGHRSVRVDPLTPPPFEAHLLQDGFTADETLQLVLEGDLRAAPRSFQIRRATTRADWDTLVRLIRLDHVEQTERAGRDPYPESLASAMAAILRARPGVVTWLARVDGADCAYLSSWPGPQTDGLRVGMLEDLFTHPDSRHRGIATALISHGVEDARTRGAGPVLIGARPDDTPRHMYQALGFRPLCVTRSYLKTPP